MARIVRFFFLLQWILITRKNQSSRLDIKNRNSKLLIEKAEEPNKCKRIQEVED